jgi:putative transposase
MIEYKAQEIGVKVILQEESHTSKCSFLDLESIEYHDKYIGRRNGVCSNPRKR